MAIITNKQKQSQLNITNREVYFQVLTKLRPYRLMI